jgi:hypothetical protein
MRVQSLLRSSTLRMICLYQAQRFLMSKMLIQRVIRFTLPDRPLPLLFTRLGQPGVVFTGASPLRMCHLYGLSHLARGRKALSYISFIPRMIDYSHKIVMIINSVKIEVAIASKRQAENLIRGLPFANQLSPPQEHLHHTLLECSVKIHFIMRALITLVVLQRKCLAMCSSKMSLTWHSQ